MERAPAPIVSAARPGALSMPSQCMVTSKPGGWPIACTGSDVPIWAKVSRKKRVPNRKAGRAGRYSLAASGLPSA